MNKIGIGIIEPVGGHGGNDIYDYNLVRSINLQEKFSAKLYTCNETNINDLRNIRKSYTNIFGKSNKIIRTFSYIIGTITSLLDAKKCHASIVHLHFFSFNLPEYFNLFLAKNIFRFKVVSTIHDVESFEKYASGDIEQHNYDKFLSLLDGVIVHTEYARNELLKHVTSDVMSQSKIQTIFASDLDYDNLNNNSIDKNKARQHLNLPENRKIILFFGQIKKVKGLDVLLESLASVSKKDQSVLLVIAGKVWKDNFAHYEKIIQKHCLESYVDLRIDFVDNEDVPYYFNASDVIALPYKKIYNSGVLIRAMSFGTPVVASDFGPFKEFINHGKNGFLFETGNVSSLSDTLISLLRNDVNLDTVCEAEKNFIEDNFSLNALGKQYANFYASILETTR